jgi:hypothetical protein
LPDKGRTRLWSSEDSNAVSSIRSHFDSLSNPTYFSDLRNCKHFSQRVFADTEVIVPVKSLPENAFDVSLWTELESEQLELFGIETEFRVDHFKRRWNWETTIRCWGYGNCRIELNKANVNADFPREVG